MSIEKKNMTAIREPDAQHWIQNSTNAKNKSPHFQGAFTIGAGGGTPSPAGEAFPRL